MRKIQDFAINLDTDRMVFYPGETISGVVFVDLIDSMKMAQLEVELKGVVFVKWKTTTFDDDGNEVVVVHTDKEKIIDKDTTLFGDSEDDKKKHEGGQHEYPFSFELPKDLPSSFEHKGYVKAYVRYYLEAKIERPWSFDHKVVRPLIINGLVDCNKEFYAVGVEGENLKEVGCLCCSSGTVSMQCRTNRSAFCPGECILLNGKFVNNLDKDLDNVKAKLMQEIRFKAEDGEEQSETIKISKLKGSEMEKEGGTATWENQHFYVPTLPPTMSTKKNIIQIRYWVEIEIDIPMAFDPTIHLPITIGTIPCISTYNKGTPSEPVKKQDILPDVEDKVIHEPLEDKVANTEAMGYPDLSPVPILGYALGQKSVDIGDKEVKVKFGKSKYMPVYTVARPYKQEATAVEEVVEAEVAATEESGAPTNFTTTTNNSTEGHLTPVDL